MIENFNLKCSKVLSISGLGKRRRKLSKCQAADGRFRWAFYVGVVFNTVIRLHWFLFWAGCRRMILEEILPIFSPQMAQIITIPQAACVDLCFQGLLCVFGGSVSYISFFTPFVNVEMTGDSAQGQTLPEGWDMKPDPKAPQSWGRGGQTSSYLSSLFWKRPHFRNSGVSLLQTSKAQASCAHPLSGLSLSTPDGQLQPQPGFISLPKVQLLKTKEFHWWEAISHQGWDVPVTAEVTVALLLQSWDSERMSPHALSWQLCPHSASGIHSKFINI